MKHRGKGRADADEWNKVRDVTGMDLRQTNRLPALALVGELFVSPGNDRRNAELQCCLIPWGVSKILRTAWAGAGKVKRCAIAGSSRVPASAGEFRLGLVIEWITVPNQVVMVKLSNPNIKGPTADA